MTRVEAHSRLHFGLLHVPTSETPPDTRVFGGLGLMLQEPKIVVHVEKAETWSAKGPLAERALAFAQAFAQHFPERSSPQCFRIRVKACPLEHCGLGVGTALGLAVAKGVAHELGKGSLDTTILAERIGRGQRSAIGVHGFDFGGVIVEGGKLPTETISPLISRTSLFYWPIVLIRPHVVTGRHGAQESSAFQSLKGPISPTDTLCRLLVTGILPALAILDFKAFGEALHEFNARAGDVFRTVQGGTYSHPLIEGLIGWIRKRGIHGVGQSSWGPTVFAIVRDPEEAESLRIAIEHQHEIPIADVQIVKAASTGARVRTRA